VIITAGRPGGQPCWSEPWTRFSARTGPERPGERVERDLRERIASGEWQADEVLPTVADLADHYEVSPGVIQRVLKRLQADGLVRVIPRWGTFRA
jgi:DNA-binding GntR family transcriptional regulator